MLESEHGDAFTVLLHATTRRDAKGNGTGVVGVGQDITERNQVMATSKRVADDLTRLIDTANVPIFGIDTFGKVTEWNAKASSLLGYSKDEAMGQHLVQRFITEAKRAGKSTLQLKPTQQKRRALQQKPTTEELRLATEADAAERRALQ